MVDRHFADNLIHDHSRSAPDAGRFVVFLIIALSTLAGVAIQGLALSLLLGPLNPWVWAVLGGMAILGTAFMTGAVNSYPRDSNP
jgi:hypothetical protein